jgi:hypothetical protein
MTTLLSFRLTGRQHIVIFSFEKKHICSELAAGGWLTPIILGTWEAEIGRLFKAGPD